MTAIPQPTNMEAGQKNGICVILSEECVNV